MRLTHELLTTTRKLALDRAASAAELVARMDDDDPIATEHLGSIATDTALAVALLCDLILEIRETNE